MLEILNELPDNIFGFRLVGRIGPGEYRDAMPLIDKIVAKTKSTRILVDWKDLNGWTPEAESEAFWERINHRDTFERVAIVGPQQWQNEAGIVSQILDCEVRFFEVVDEHAALEWLNDL